MIKEGLGQLLERHDLSRTQAREVMAEIMDGEASPAQIGAYLVALRMKGETPQEIAGSAEAMRSHAVPVACARPIVIDTAGTGGDGAGTLNISTAAALVAAAAGVPVAKHGNRAISSASGSADVLEALGFSLDLEPPAIAASIDELGFGFLFAPAHHPAMRHAGPVRRELAARTVFNVLGPLTNPAGASAQIIGVYAPELVGRLAEVLAMLGTKRALVVHGAGGIDELSPAGPNLVHEVRDGEVTHTIVDPADFGVPRCRPSDLAGGTPENNAADIRAIFDGSLGPKRDAVLLNAAGALLVAGMVDRLADGYGLAGEAVDSGAAGQRLVDLAAFSRRAATPPQAVAS
jgi:anthranilate phosphoribosyltransferase